MADVRAEDDSAAAAAGLPWDAIVVAAGRGARLGSGSPKGRAPLAGVPLFLHALRVLGSAPGVDRIILVAPPEADELAAMEADLERGWSREQPPVTIIPGGEERQDSVWAALNALRKFERPEDGIVLVHDAARPLLSPELVSRCLEAMMRPVPRDGQDALPGLVQTGYWGSGPGGIVPGLPVRETLKVVYEGRIVLTQPREHLYAVQTPQVFRFGPLFRAHDQAHRFGMRATDDAALLEWQGIPVFIVPGEFENLKITFPEDLELAERLLSWRKREAGRDSRHGEPGDAGPGSRRGESGAAGRDARHGEPGDAGEHPGGTTR